MKDHIGLTCGIINSYLTLLPWARGHVECLRFQYAL